MIIDKYKPLPDHTKLNYDECCALLILKDLFPDRYSDLEIADRPDLQGRRIGVEVTIADESNHQEALNNWVKAYNCEDKKKKQRYIERMSQLGVRYTGGIQCWPGYEPTFKQIHEAVESKVQKVREGRYMPFPQYELFVFTDTWMHKDIINEAKKFFLQQRIYDVFSRVYILQQGYLLFVFEENGCDCFKLDISEQSARNIRARQMVEMAEEQE